MKKFNFFTFLIFFVSFISCKETKNAENNTTENQEIKANSDEITSLSWLQGSWENEDKTSIETWAIQDNQLTGNVYSIKENKIIETLSIENISGKLRYNATVLAQNEGKTISFDQKEIGSNSISFYNQNHDYPNTISYNKTSDKVLSVFISGDNGNFYTYNMTLLD